MGGTTNSWDFFKQDHAEPGRKKVLGKVIPAGKGGLRKLTDFLASHEHTIKYISYKLTQHFVSDNPSQSDVDFIANAWRKSNGNLDQIHSAVIDRAIMSFRNDENLKNNKDLNKIIDGIEVVKKDLVSIFKKNGIESIECINKKFDPNFHQAMLEVEDNTKKPGTVVQEIQKGYMMKDRLLRPSLVSVTKKREEKLEKTTNDDKKTDKKSEKK